VIHTICFINFKYSNINSEIKESDR